MIPTSEPSAEQLELVPAYASFTRRFQGVALDAVVVLTGVVVIAVISDMSRDVPGSGRVAVAALLGLIFLYEPVMVARYGGTLGHRVVNLRVVDDATGGNPGFLRALARFVIKTALGILSFTAMALTRRHQAVHDSLTHTTVQVRDLSRARPGHYRVERDAVEIDGLPSRGRRLAVIAAYLVALFVVLAAVSGLLLPDTCLDGIHCTAGQELVSRALGFAWLALSVVSIVAGWRGRLPGARATPNDSAVSADG